MLGGARVPLIRLLAQFQVRHRHERHKGESTGGKGAFCPAKWYAGDRIDWQMAVSALFPSCDPAQDGILLNPEFASRLDGIIEK